MSLMMMLALRGASLKTQTFTSNTTWTAPAGVSNLVSLVGTGGAGTPYVPGSWGYTTYTTSTNLTTGQVIGPTYLSTTYNSPTPSNYCTTIQQQPDSYYVCYDFRSFDNSTPQTTGGTTTAFGKSFAGGVGGPATPVTYTNIAVVPGQSYSIVVPPGGSVTISYYA